MTITIVLKDGREGSFSNGEEAYNWYSEQKRLRELPEKKAKKGKGKKGKDVDDKPAS